ncbi:hypothetical protein TSAR_014996, partial [Trichomalopsis sarcophagae]
MKNRDTNIEVNSVACSEVSSAFQTRLRGAPAPLDVKVREVVYPASTDIVAVSRANRLEKILKYLKDSIWCNHERNFIIVNSNGVDSCQMFCSFLTITWIYNMMYVLYFCTSSNGTFMLYTFNPFTDSAPISWNKVQDQSLNNGHCNTISASDLFCDKMKSFNGYNLKVIFILFSDHVDRYNRSKSGTVHYTKTQKNKKAPEPNMQSTVRNQTVFTFQQQQQNIDYEELDSFCQASTVKKGSKRGIEQLETLAPRNVSRKLNLQFKNHHIFADKLLTIMLNSNIATLI